MYGDKAIKIHAHTEKGWKIVRSYLTKIGITQAYEIAEVLEKHYGRKHYFLPAEINPEEYPVILEMEKILNQHTDSFLNDFYLIDLFLYFTRGGRIIWALRDTGTDAILLDEVKASDMELYYFYLNQNDFFYIVEKGKITKTTRDAAVLFIKKELTVIV